VLVAEARRKLPQRTSTGRRSPGGARGAFKEHWRVHNPAAAQSKDGSANITLGAKGAVEFRLLSAVRHLTNIPRKKSTRQITRGLKSRVADLSKLSISLVADDGHSPSIDGCSKMFVRSLLAKTTDCRGREANPDAQAKRALALAMD
jgi:hypothetical protein